MPSRERSFLTRTKDVLRTVGKSFIQEPPLRPIGPATRLIDDLRQTNDCATTEELVVRTFLSPGEISRTLEPLIQKGNVVFEDNTYCLTDQGKSTHRPESSPLKPHQTTT